MTSSRRERKPKERRRPAAGRPGAGARRSARAACDAEHALEVRRRYLVARARRVEVAQLRDRERRPARARTRCSCTRASRAAARGRRARSRVVERQLAGAGRPGASSCPPAAPGRRRSARGRGRRSRAAIRTDGARVAAASRAARGATSSRTSTFAARWRRIDSSSVSPGSRSPPGSDQLPANGSRARSQSSTCSCAVANLEDDGQRDVRGRRPVFASGSETCRLAQRFSTRESKTYQDMIAGRAEVRPGRRRRRRRRALRGALRGRRGATSLLLSKGPAARVDELARAGRHRGRARDGRLARAARRRHAPRRSGALPPERRARPDRGGARADRRPGRARRRVRRGASASKAGTRAAASCTPAAPRPASGSPRALAERVPAHPAHRRARGRARERPVDGRRPLRRRRHRRARVAARATLLATGGFAALWERTTNPPGAVGEGIVLAYRAGAALADLEFVQFHPTVLADERPPALRGAPRRGGRPARRRRRALHRRAGAARRGRPRDRRARHRAARPAPDRPRALPRPDGAARARGLRPGAPSRSPSRRPRTTRSAASSPTSTAAPTCPASTPPASAPAPASTARTGWPRTRCSSASSSAAGPRSRPWARPICPRRLPRVRQQLLPRSRVTAELRRALWQDAGLVRDAAGLERLRRSPHLLARLVAESALARAESRGGHFRLDYPTEDPTLRPRRPPTRPGAGASSDGA